VSRFSQARCLNQSIFRTLDSRSANHLNPRAVSRIATISVCCFFVGKLSHVSGRPSCGEVWTRCTSTFTRQIEQARLHDDVCSPSPGQAKQAFPERPRLLAGLSSLIIWGKGLLKARISVERSPSLVRPSLQTTNFPTKLTKLNFPSI
jgi:hypothetical protein